MEKLRIGLIGCGSIAPVHVAAIQDNSKAQLTAVCDIDETRASKFAQEAGCDYTTDYHELLHRDDIDVVHICTPHYLHGPMAMEALEAGKHVLVEKPIAMTLDDAKKVIELAEKNGKQVGAVFQNRYNEASVQIKSWLESGDLGALLGMRAFVTWSRDANYYHSGEWRGKWDTEGGGVLINQSIHTLDLLQWFGGELSFVKGAISTLVLQDVIEVEDTAHAILQFKNGVRAVFFATNGYNLNSPVDIELTFEKGIVTQRRESLYLLQDNEEHLVCEPPMQERVGRSYWGVGHARCIQDFYTCILEDRPFPISGREALKALSIVKEIYNRP